MKCEEFIELIHDGVDGELTGEPAARFRKHAGECDSCGRKAESVRRLKKLVQVKARTEVAPAGLERLVRQRLDSEPLVRTLPYRGLAAASLLLAVVIFMVVSRGFQPGIPEIAHALAVEEAMEKCDKDCTRPVTELDDYADRLLNAMPNPDLFAVGEMELVGWNEETFGEEGIPAIRMQLRYKDTEVVCFAFRANLTVCPKTEGAAKERPEDAPRDVCLCKRTDDGETVICYRLANCEGVQMITVLHPKLAKLLSDDNVQDLKNVLVTK